MKELEDVIAYLKDRYDINISTENYIRNKLAMKNAGQERLEAKLKLWETPGFSQFLSDFADRISGKVWDSISIVTHAEILRLEYQRKLAELKEAESKFKQGKLDL